MAGYGFGTKTCKSYWDFLCFIRPASIAPVLSASFSRSRPLFVSMKPTLMPTFSWVTTSASEDLAILRNFIWSLMCSLSTPSAIFEGTERPALVIWSLKPKSFMCLLFSYIWQDSSKAAFHASSLLNFIICSILDCRVTPVFRSSEFGLCFQSPASTISDWKTEYSSCSQQPIFRSFL